MVFEYLVAANAEPKPAYGNLVDVMLGPMVNAEVAVGRIARVCEPDDDGNVPVYIHVDLESEVEARFEAFLSRQGGADVRLRTDRVEEGVLEHVSPPEQPDVIQPYEPTIN